MKNRKKEDQRIDKLKHVTKKHNFLKYYELIKE